MLCGRTPRHRHRSGKSGVLAGLYRDRLVSSVLLKLTVSLCLFTEAFLEALRCRAMLSNSTGTPNIDVDVVCALNNLQDASN